MILKNEINRWNELKKQHDISTAKLQGVVLLSETFHMLEIINKQAEAIKVMQEGLEDIGFCKTWTAQNDGMSLVEIALDARKKAKQLNNKE